MEDKPFLLKGFLFRGHVNFRGISHFKYTPNKKTWNLKINPWKRRNIDPHQKLLGFNMFVFEGAIPSDQGLQKPFAEPPPKNQALNMEGFHGESG